MNRESHSYGCLMAVIPESLAKKVRDFGKAIPDDRIFDDGTGEKGRQKEVHITVKYGIHTSDVAEVLNVIEKVKPLKAVLGKTTVFWNENIVIKVAVQSQDLTKLNAKIRRELKCTDKYPDYKPHVTLAYVKKDEKDPYWFQQYLKNDFEGVEVVIDELVFSTPDGQKYQFLLKEDKMEDKISKISARVAKQVVAGDEWFDKQTEIFTKQLIGVMKRDPSIKVTGVKDNRVRFTHSPNILVNVPLVLEVMEFGYLGAGDGSDEDEPTYESLNGTIFSEEITRFRIPGGTTNKRDPVEFWKTAMDSLDEIIRMSRG